ncbi:MAG: UDP-N-acetylmuramate--L-alanine ligase [Thermodesulfobacteriota bacterium]
MTRIIDQETKLKQHLPESPRHVHLMGICGTGMSALAGLFHESGCTVTGSDHGVYPPISEFLSRLGISVKEVYTPENLALRPDVVVVGNVIRRDNPEAVYLEGSGIPFTSMPVALRTYFMKGKRRLVVAGTHGKTTVTSMIAWILREANLDPGFMIGGIPLNFRTNYWLGTGDLFVVEGDEYDTAYFDKVPKFLHYAPDVAVITSCEFDHADIYRSLAQIQDQFRALTHLIPPRGTLIAWTGHPNVLQIAEQFDGRLLTYGLGSEFHWSVRQMLMAPDGTHIEVTRAGHLVATGALPLFGVHNISNALAAIAVCAEVGVDPQNAVNALARFQGVRRRQEVLGEQGGILVIDDFAHHPTAVGVTCAAVRSRFPARRLVAVFEPRTNTSKRSIFQEQYVDAFLAVDVIVLREARDVELIPVAQRFSSERLANDLRVRGKEAYSFSDTEGILAFLAEILRQGDVVLVMSNGSFDNVASRLLRSLGEHEQ